MAYKGEVKATVTTVCVSGTLIASLFLKFNASCQLLALSIPEFSSIIFAIG